MTKKPRVRKSYREDPSRPDYGDATPEDLARALLLYRPDEKTVIKAQTDDAGKRGENDPTLDSNRTRG